ncbi:extracellular solute-binding protein, partial [Okeania hirsuta]
MDALAAGKPPDIFFSKKAEHTLIPQWASEGKLVDVSDLIKPIKNFYSDSAFKSAYLCNILCCTIEEGDRRQLYWRQEENYMG